MKKLVILVATLMTTPAICSATISDVSLEPNALVNHVEARAFSDGMQLAGYVNPSWGAGTGFHWVQRRNGTRYLRSNPDGVCWNNKYGC